MSVALPAFLLEAVFYLGSLFERPRQWLKSLGPPRLQATLLWVSALLPYCIFAAFGGTFIRNAFVLLALLTGLLAYWFVVCPRRPAYDIGFFVVAALPMIARLFPRLYLSPDPHLKGLDILGHLMWIRLGIAALLILREWDPGGFGLWPRPREWRIGLLYYAASLLPVAALALVLHDVQFNPPLHISLWQSAGSAIGYFFGIFWVVALGEDLLLFGVVERALLNAWDSRTAALIVSALLFGAIHLWFHQFPNWPRAAVAGLLGLACGLAYLQTGSVRAPMVTHALMVTTWRVLFK